MDNDRYSSVDDLQARTSLEDAAAKCGVTLDIRGSGRQVRLDCPFGCPGDHSGKRELSVDTGNPQKVFCCHAYGCQLRGNLLMLMHGWTTGTRPIGDKLKGDDFKRVRNVLAGEVSPPHSDRAGKANKPAEQKPGEPLRNIPLAESKNEKARELVTLDEKFIRDVGRMPPAAASYVRRHACLSSALMEKWRVGVLPQDGGADKRGWSLRGQLLYPLLSETGMLLAWIARDPRFEMSEREFNAMPPERRAREKRPMKHRFPVDFHRGIELFGQHGCRLEEPGYRETIAEYGVIVVEGFNDVLGLDALRVPAVAVMSNRMTEEQATKVERFARRLSGGKVSVLFDADEAGDTGAKEALWRLSQLRLDVRLGLSRVLHGGMFDGRQPESITREEWEQAILPVLAR